MKTMIAALALMLTLCGQIASAGCDPCICGMGGGLPPPPECGKRSDDNDSLAAILSNANGVMSVQRIESSGGAGYRISTRLGTYDVIQVENQ